MSLVLGSLTLAMIACGFSVTTANFGSAQMALDPEANQPTTTFSPDDTFYAVVDLNNAPDDTTVRAEWIAVDVEGAEDDTVIDQAEITTDSGQLHFNLESTSPWPEGQYEVNLYIDDELTETLEFQVQQ